MTRRSHRAWALVAALVVGSVSRGADAQSAADVDAARELFREGSKLSLDGKWNEARDKYERSLKLKRAAITLYSLGVAQSSTGRLVEALENFRAFLAEPSSPGTQRFEQHAREAVASLEKRVARVAISIEPANQVDLVVRIGDEPVPSIALDIPRLVNPGTHVVHATARDRAPFRGEFTVKEGESAAMKITLVVGKAAPPAAVVLKPAVKQSPPPPTEAPPPRPSRTLPIALIAGGGALLVGGVVVGLLGVSQAGDAPTRDGPDASAARTKSAIGDVLGGVGLATAGVGVVLLFLEKPGRKPATSAGVAKAVAWPAEPSRRWSSVPSPQNRSSR